MVLHINKETLKNYTNQIISNLEIAHKLWLEFYEKSNEAYVMDAYGGFYTEFTPIDEVTFDEKVRSWECGTSCCRIGDLPRAFPIKAEYFDKSGVFSYDLFSKDIFTPINFDTFLVNDLTQEEKNAIINLVATELVDWFWIPPYWAIPSNTDKLLSYRFIWDFLFRQNLTGTREELDENYPKVIRVLKGILEIIG